MSARITRTIKIYGHLHRRERNYSWVRFTHDKVFLNMLRPGHRRRDSQVQYFPLNETASKYAVQLHYISLLFGRWNMVQGGDPLYGSDSPERGKWTKCGIFLIFGALLWPNGLAFQLFSTVLYGVATANSDDPYRDRSNYQKQESSSWVTNYEVLKCQRGCKQRRLLILVPCLTSPPFV